MSYAAIKGRIAPLAPTFRKAEVKALSAAEQSTVEANKDFVLEYMPDMLPLIRQMHADGLIDGWRNITRCTLLDAGGHE